MRPRIGAAVKIKRRIGVPPQERGSLSGETCPDVFELSDGQFAVIGTEATTALKAMLPRRRELLDHERIVIVNRETFVRAKRDIPDS
jgi:hypothetical protein